MNFIWLIAAYSASCIAIISIFLFGQLSWCQSTPLGAAHRFLVNKAPSVLRKLALSCCGTRSDEAFDKLYSICCQSRNPAIQILYVTLVSLGYYVYCKEFFGYLPQPYAPKWHEFGGAASVGLTILSFWVTSASDPGYVSEHNVAGLLMLYGQKSEQGQRCATCKLQRPARSKHCQLCKRCIARFDHHCAWVNNCIGALNLRWFLLFLLCNFLLCSYAVVVGVLILRGAAIKTGRLETPQLNYKTGEVVIVRESWFLMTLWITTHFSLQVILLVFLAMAALCVAGFLTYHLFIIGCGITTYENLKGQGFFHHSAQNDPGRPEGSILQRTIRSFKDVLMPHSSCTSKHKTS